MARLVLELGWFDFQFGAPCTHLYEVRGVSVLNLLVLILVCKASSPLKAV